MTTRSDTTSIHVIIHIHQPVQRQLNY